MVIYAGFQTASCTYAIPGDQLWPLVVPTIDERSRPLHRDHVTLAVEQSELDILVQPLAQHSYEPIELANRQVVARPVLTF